MSNDISNQQTPNPEPLDEWERSSAESFGRSAGRSWTRALAGVAELSRLYGCALGQPPDLHRSQDTDQAILELVRIIQPSCALHVDSARDYWHELAGISSYRDRMPFITSFLDEALDAAQAMVMETAERAAEDWLRHRTGPWEVDNVERFVEQYGDIRERPYPGDCANPIEVPYLMACGRLAYEEEEIEDDDEYYEDVDASREAMVDYYEWMLGTSHFAQYYEEFIRAFVLRAVAIVRELHAEGRRLADFSEGMASEADDNSAQETAPHTQTPETRDFRNVKIRDRDEAVDNSQDVAVPPPEPGRTPSPPTTPRRRPRS